MQIANTLVQTVEKTQETNPADRLKDLDFDFSVSICTLFRLESQKLPLGSSSVYYITSFDNFCATFAKKVTSFAIYALDTDSMTLPPTVNNILIMTTHTDNEFIECDSTWEPCIAYQNATEVKTKTVEFELPRKEIWVPQLELVQMSFDQIVLNSRGYVTFLLKIFSQTKVPAYAAITCPGRNQLETVRSYVLPILERIIALKTDTN